MYYDKIAEMRNGTVREVVQTPHAMIATVVTVLLSPNASLYVARYTGRLYMQNTVLVLQTERRRLRPF